MEKVDVWDSGNLNETKPLLRLDAGIEFALNVDGADPDAVREITRLMLVLKDTQNRIYKIVESRLSEDAGNVNDWYSSQVPAEYSLD